MRVILSAEPSRSLQNSGVIRPSSSLTVAGLPPSLTGFPIKHCSTQSILIFCLGIFLLIHLLDYKHKKSRTLLYKARDSVFNPREVTCPLYHGDLGNKMSSKAVLLAPESSYWSRLPIRLLTVAYNCDLRPRLQRRVRDGLSPYFSFKAHLGFKALSGRL